MNKDVLAYYSRGQEQGRLFRGSGHLELARNKELIERHLSPPPSTVLDVGGGPGTYSCWLAANGYEVHLIDPVAVHLEQAKEASDGQPENPIASISEGDARSLTWDDASCDAVLLMGPLYHLPDKDDRLAALREAHRVLRPGGLLFATIINRFASLMDGLTRWVFDDPEMVKMIDQDMADGQHRNPERHPDYFTTAYFQRHTEFQNEVREAGFTVVETCAVQGPGLAAKDLDECWDDAVKRELLLHLVRSVEHEESLFGVSPHVMMIARK